MTKETAEKLAEILNRYLSKGGAEIGHNMALGESGYYVEEWLFGAPDGYRSHKCTHDDEGEATKFISDMTT